MSKLKMNIVSDVACPWRPIGYKRLEAAMTELTEADLAFEIEWGPFELAPEMPTEGEPIVPHVVIRFQVPRGSPLTAPCVSSDCVVVVGCPRVGVVALSRQLPCPDGPVAYPIEQPLRAGMTTVAGRWKTIAVTSALE